MKTKANNVNEFLQNNNILPGVLGYEYIKYILMNYDEPISFIKMMHIYEDVAYKFGSTSTRVERCIRQCVSKTALQGTNKQVLAQLQLNYKGW